MAYAGKTGETRPLRALPTAKRRESPVGVFATGAAIGLVVGAGLALLLAPQGGSETRGDIRRGARRLRHRGAEAWEDLRLELRHALRQLRRARRRARQAAAEHDLDD